MSENKDGTDDGTDVVSVSRLLALLAAMDEWLGNEDGLMIEDVVEWRYQLASALGKPPRA